MKDKKEKKVCCTNMDEDDPIIEKFLKEYLSEKDDKGNVEKNDDLIVNFDITYADGESESYICNNESEVFGGKKEVFADRKEKKEEDHIDEDNSYYRDNNRNYDIESEIGKWTNCVDEWCKFSSKSREREEKIDKKPSCEEVKYEEIKHEEQKEECKCEGKITVYSILSLNESTTLKGVTVNLYKINGVKPELVDSKETDAKGMVVFNKVRAGNYRIIQIIDKRYFERPTYLTWNEVNICESNKEYVLYVLNNLKNYRKN